MRYAVFRRKDTSPKQKRVLVILVGMITIGILAAAGTVWAISGSQAKISEMPARSMPLPAADQLYEGKYIQFDYKGIYHVSRSNNLGTDLELVSLSATTGYEKYLAVAVSPLPDGKLEDNSGYNMRKTSPGIYTSRTVAIDGGTAIVYTRDTSEQTAFIQRGDKVAVLAFTTTPDNLDNLQPEVDLLLKTFRWKG